MNFNRPVKLMVSLKLRVVKDAYSCSGNFTQQFRTCGLWIPDPDVPNRSLVIQPFSVTDNMRRLKQEKEQLLKSGVYEESDRIIQEINHQIKEALLDT